MGTWHDYLLEKGIPESDIIMDGGTLHIRWNDADDRVYLSGPAKFVFEGSADLP